MKTPGKFLIPIGWILIVLSVLATIGMIQGSRQRDPSIEAFLNHPDSLSLGGTIGVIIGTNLLTIPAILFGIYAVLRKNPKGKRLVITSIILFFIVAGVQFVPSSNSSAESQSQPTGQYDAKIMAEELSQTLEGISKENITKELIDKLNDVPIKYTSLSDGFAVYFPSTPQKNTIKNVMGSTVKNYQSVSQDELVQYNVFFHYFDKKILSDKSQEAFLGSHLAGRLLISKNSRVITNNKLIFRGFNARNYEYIDVVEGIEILHEGIIFILDGDSVSLTCVYPKAVEPQPSFDEFVKSFELLPLEARLSGEYWKDFSTGLMFRPPIDMHEREKKSRKSIIVTFVNKAGHSLSIINVTADYPSFKLSDIKKEFPQATKDSEGFLVNTIHNSTSNMDFIQLVKLLEHKNNIFMFQGYAPKQSFFRSERIFKKSMNTVTFED
jgi:hypothetical protein